MWHSVGSGIWEVWHFTSMTWKLRVGKGDAGKGVWRGNHHRSRFWTLVAAGSFRRMRVRETPAQCWVWEICLWEEQRWHRGDRNRPGRRSLQKGRKNLQGDEVAFVWWAQIHPLLAECSPMVSMLFTLWWKLSSWMKLFRANYSPLELLSADFVFWVIGSESQSKRICCLFHPSNFSLNLN